MPTLAWLLLPPGVLLAGSALCFVLAYRAPCFFGAPMFLGAWGLLICGALSTIAALCSALVVA